MKHRLNGKTFLSIGNKILLRFDRVTKRRRAVGKTSFKCGGCGEEFGDKKVRRSHYKVDVCAGFDYGNPYKYIGVYDEDWRE